MFLLKVAAGSVVALVTALLVLGTLIYAGAGDDAQTREGVNALMVWFALLFVGALAWGAASWGFRRVMRR